MVSLNNLSKKTGFTKPKPNLFSGNSYAATNWESISVDSILLGRLLQILHVYRNE